MGDPFNSSASKYEYMCGGRQRNVAGFCVSYPQNCNDFALCIVRPDPGFPQIPGREFMVVLNCLIAQDGTQRKQEHTSFLPKQEGTG